MKYATLLLSGVIACLLIVNNVRTVNSAEPPTQSEYVKHFNKMAAKNCRQVVQAIANLNITLEHRGAIDFKESNFESAKRHWSKGNVSDNIREAARVLFGKNGVALLDEKKSDLKFEELMQKAATKNNAVIAQPELLQAQYALWNTLKCESRI